MRKRQIFVCWIYTGSRICKELGVSCHNDHGLVSSFYHYKLCQDVYFCRLLNIGGNYTFWFYFLFRCFLSVEACFDVHSLLLRTELRHICCDLIDSKRRKIGNLKQENSAGVSWKLWAANSLNRLFQPHALS